MEPEQQKASTVREHGSADQRRWNILSSIPFVLGAGLSLVTMANNIRYTFWHNFVQGFGEIRTPFSDIKEKYAKAFKSTVSEYEQGSISSADYSVAMRKNARDYRQEVFTRLEKDFNIPSNGLKGWTEGTIKRWKELGVTARIHNTVGIASITATTIGAAVMLAHHQHANNRIEEKLDETQSLRR
jgi:hypothetical protein